MGDPVPGPLEGRLVIGFHLRVFEAKAPAGWSGGWMVEPTQLDLAAEEEGAGRALEDLGSVEGPALHRIRLGVGGGQASLVAGGCLGTDEEERAASIDDGELPESGVPVSDQVTSAHLPPPVGARDRMVSAGRGVGRNVLSRGRSSRYSPESSASRKVPFGAPRPRGVRP